MRYSLGLPKKKKKRSLTASQKYGLKADVGNKCQYCGKKKDPRLLHVHHITGVAKAKTEGMSLYQFDLFYAGKKRNQHMIENLI